MKNLFSILLICVLISCQHQGDKEVQVTAFNSIENSEIQVYTEKQKEIIETYVEQCAHQYSYVYNHQQYQKCLDQAIQEDPQISYVWQQKAMPYFKARKYEVGMRYLDKAVKINKARYLSYRGFINCIFVKDYESAIRDFEEIKSMVGNSFEMDHSYNFYIALSHLQLNNFKEAEKLFKKEIDDQISEWGAEEYHHLLMFYYGISLYEQQKFKAAISALDKTLKKYPNFSDAMFYKSICLYQQGNPEFKTLAEKARENGKAGNTINEDNAIYETYPYQIRWQ